jgi:hypothetical protein
MAVAATSRLPFRSRRVRAASERQPASMVSYQQRVACLLYQRKGLRSFSSRLHYRPCFASGEEPESGPQRVSAFEALSTLG